MAIEQRSGLQTAADLARFGKSVAKIIKAAAAAGLKGAAVAAANADDHAALAPEARYAVGKAALLEPV